MLACISESRNSMLDSGIQCLLIRYWIVSVSDQPGSHVRAVPYLEGVRSVVS